MLRLLLGGKQSCCHTNTHYRYDAAADIIQVRHLKHKTFN